MKLVILAAGQGTRLRPLTDDKPKTLVTVGGTYIRNTLNSRSWDFQNEEHRFDEWLQPFLEISPDIYDLDQFNNEYWNKLTNFLSLRQKFDA